MREFKITREKLLNVLEILINYVDCVTRIIQSPEGYTVEFLFELPDPDDYSKDIEYQLTGKGDDIVSAMQSIVDQMQMIITERLEGGETRLIDWLIEFEVNMAYALGNTKRVCQKDRLKNTETLSG
jgi:hypothetical protein